MEKPILFNGKMVRAILGDMKTQTRRLMGYKPKYKPGDILRVRETWAEMPYGYVYRADGENPEGWDNTDR